jgi:outer membrane receptor protein involved in Fe transport
VNYLGYQETVKRIEVEGDERFNIELPRASLTTEAIEIEGKKEDANIDDPQMSRIDVEMEELRKLPALLGEVDVMRSIKLLPGVRSGGNGSSGLSVRGGAPDQNQVMLDDAIIYRPSHLFGFFSVFNGGAIDGVELYKGAIPARYGGRLSSVVDVSMKRGDMDRFKASGGIGLLSSRLMVQGPIVQDTTSFMFAARRTYADLVARPFIPKSSAFHGTDYHFYDLNAKLTHRFSEKDRLTLSAYGGRDRFRFEGLTGGIDMKVPWGNRVASLQWQHEFDEDLSLNTSLVYSDYDFRFGATQSQFSLSLYSGVRDYALKSDLLYRLDDTHTIRTGIDYSYHRFTPTHVDAGSGEIDFESGQFSHIYAHEASAYVSDEMELTEDLTFHPGIRFSSFHQVGPFERYLQDELNRVLDTVHYAPGEVVASYSGWEPRAALRYRFREDLSVKGSYTRNYQYLHMASISPVSLPTDVWLPSTDRVEPQIGDQVALGVYKNFLDNALESSIELYYREMKNLVEFEDGAAPENSVQTNIDAQLTFGRGTSYGAEFFLKKRKGDLTGWFSYTLAKSVRSFPEIDGGDPFPAKYDRRHDLSLTGSYRINEHWSVGGTFVYTSGKAISLPSSRYFIEGRLVTEYGPRNSYRMKPYHRADLSIRYDPSDRKKKKDPLSGDLLKVPQRISSEWVLSIYNVYNRANPYFLYFKNSGSLAKGTLNVSAEQVTLFPILPSLSWEFEF